MHGGGTKVPSHAFKRCDIVHVVNKEVVYLHDAFVSETLRTPHKRDYDIIVAGGGIAGCSAAIAARRYGYSVLLIEKNINLGGLATNGLVVYFNPSLCDQKGNQLIGGIAEELMHRSIRYGRGDIPSPWAYRKKKIEGDVIYKTTFAAPAFVAALDEIMREEGIDVLFDSVCTGVLMNGNEGLCCGVFVENKEGRVFYGAKQVVDTTGDVDLFKRAGAPCVEDLNWNSYWALMLTMDSVRDCLEKDDIRNALKVKSFASGMDGLNNPQGLRQYTIETGEEVSAYITDGREYLLKYLKTMDKTQEMPVFLPSQAQYRTTRRICGNYLLDEIDRDAHHEDSIGCAHTHKYGGFSLEFPYRSLVVSGYKNMITAGRTISSSMNVRGLTRLIAPSAMTGEAAGTAAAMAIEKKLDINNIPVSQLQSRLVAAGGILHF